VEWRRHLHRNPELVMFLRACRTRSFLYYAQIFLLGLWREGNRQVYCRFILALIIVDKYSKTKNTLFDSKSFCQIFSQKGCVLLDTRKFSKVWARYKSVTLILSTLRLSFDLYLPSYCVIRFNGINDFLLIFQTYLYLPSHGLFLWNKRENKCQCALCQNGVVAVLRGRAPCAKPVYIYIYIVYIYILFIN
jgi:hypothetical protein